MAKHKPESNRQGKNDIRSRFLVMSGANYRESKTCKILSCTPVELTLLYTRSKSYRALYEAAFRSAEKSIGIISYNQKRYDEFRGMIREELDELRIGDGEAVIIENKGRCNQKTLRECVVDLQIGLKKAMEFKVGIEVQV